MTVDVRREGDELYSTSGASRWRTALPAADLDRAYRDLCEWDADGLRYERDEHVALRRALGRALLGDPSQEGTPASTLLSEQHRSDRPGPGELALRLCYRLADPGQDAWRIPFEAALVPWSETETSLADAGIAIVQSGAHSPDGARVRVPARPLVALLAPTVPDTSSLFVPDDSVRTEVRHTLDGLLHTGHGYDFRRADPHLRAASMPERIDALQVLAHGTPGTVLLEDGARLPEKVEAARLGDFASIRSLAVAVLTVCHSAEGVAQELRQAGTGLVVAFRGHLMATVVEEVSRRLWTALAGGTDVDEALLEVRRDLEQRDRTVDAVEARTAPCLVVLHDEQPAVPFADAHRAGEEDRGALRRSIGREVLDGLPWRLDAGCVLDRRPGTVVVVDRSGGDLVQTMQGAERAVRSLATECGLPYEPRNWTSKPADELPGDLAGPTVVPVPAGATPAQVVDMWKAHVGSERLVFRIAGGAGADGGGRDRRDDVIAEGRLLAAELAVLDERVVLVERIPRPMTSAADVAAERSAALVDQLAAGAGEGNLITSLPADVAADLAEAAAMRLDGPHRGEAERLLCTSVPGAEGWLRGCRRANRTPPSPEAASWGPAAPVARRCLAAAWLRLDSPRPELVWLHAARDPDLPAVVDRVRKAEHDGVPVRTSAVIASRGEAELIVAAGKCEDWSGIEPPHLSRAGFDTIAAALVPSARAVHLLSVTETWGWTPHRTTEV